jgi:site-specific DNA-adenine methylase
MPDFGREALANRALLRAYQSRPPYQQNDYIGWITRAKRQETQQKRLAQMVDELEKGNVYMNMPWKGGKKPESKRMSDATVQAKTGIQRRAWERPD